MRVIVGALFIGVGIIALGGVGWLVDLHVDPGFSTFLLSVVVAGLSVGGMVAIIYGLAGMVFGFLPDPD